MYCAELEDLPRGVRLSILTGSRGDKLWNVKGCGKGTANKYLQINCSSVDKIYQVTKDVSEISSWYGH